MPTSHDLGSASGDNSQALMGDALRTVFPQLMLLALASSCLLLAGCNKDSAQGFQSYTETAGPENDENLRAAQNLTAVTEIRDNTGPESSATAETGASQVLPAASSSVLSPVSADPDSAKTETSPAVPVPLPEASPEVASSDAAVSADPASTPPAGDPGGLPATDIPAASLEPGTNPVADPANVEAGNSTATADSPPETPAEPRTIELLIPEKQFRTEKNTKAIRISYDDIDLLKVLNMEPVPLDAVNHFPAWLKALDGTQVRIRGFMFPTYEATGLTAFTLARDNGICCFVRQPKIYDIIEIEMAPGKTSDYIDGKPFDVEGTFRIQPEADDKTLYRLYRVENARVLLR
jgi:hypothetical protein